MKPVQWGVLGAANIAVEKVIPAMQKGSLSRVVAVASRSLEKAQQAADRHGISRAYGSYEALLSDPDVEAVYNPLPNHLHVPWSIRAVDAGKHVLCEKPIAMNVTEAIALGRAATHAGVLVGEAFMVRSHPQWHEVRRRVSAGQIGDLQLIHGHFSYGRRPPADVRNRIEYGGGVLMDIGCYPITIARWMFGREPVAVIAAIERDPETGVDHLTSGMLNFGSGHATFSCGGQMVPHQHVELFGERGRIDIDIPFTPSTERPARVLIDDGLRRPSSTELLEFPAVDQYTLQGDEFSAAIRGVGTVPTGIDDAIGNMKVIDALVKSAENGRWSQV